MANPSLELLISLGIDDTTSRSNIETYIKQLKNLPSIKVDIDGSSIKSSSAEVDELKSIINDLNKEVNKLNQDLGKLGSSGTKQVVKDFDDISDSVKRVNNEINKTSTSNLSKNIKKDYISMLNDFEKLDEYLSSLQVRVKVSKNSNDEITKYVAQVRNELNQIETLTIKPVTNPFGGGLSGFNVSSVIDDTATFKLTESLEQAALKLKQLELQGKLSAGQIAEFNKRLAEASSNTAIEKIVTDMQALGRESIHIDNIVKGLKDLERGGYASEASMERFRQRLANLPSGDLGKVRELLDDINNEADKIARENKVEKFVRDTTLEIGKLEAQITKTQQLYRNSYDRQEAQRAIADMQQLRNELDRIARLASQDINLVNDRTMSGLNNQLRQANVQVKEFNANATTAVRNSIGMVESLKTAFEKFPVWMLASTAFYSTTRGIQDLTTKVIELDSALVNLQRVADGSQFEFDSVIERSIENVDALSGKLNEYMELVTEFARMGNTIDESFDLANTTQMLTNISDLKPEESVNSLTAAMIAFNIEAEDSVRIADKLNEVDNNYAITTRDLSQSMNKAASTAATFGVELDTLLGHTVA